MKNWVSEILKHYNLDKEFSDQQALISWNEVVGSQLGKLTRATKLYNGTLTVETASNAVSQELNLLAQSYITMLNERMGRQVVLKIRFIPGNFSRVRVADNDDAKDQAIDDEIELSDVDDPYLRDSFVALYQTQRKREEAMLRAGAHRCPRCGVVFFGKEKICPGCRYDQIDDV
jgi:predicted Zn-ribbon and HTH transcriptional regulator